ncbi:MAG: peptidase rane alanine aminopeptidase [Acidimicrobiales bacterium]|nr:peptidase rane alanine aminopeptidase [Acidimicrobiales bacterium]
MTEPEGEARGSVARVVAVTGRGRTRGRAAGAGALVVLLLVAGGCTVASDDGTGRNPPAPGSANPSGASTSTPAGSAAAPLPDDVPDGALPGLGDPRIDVQTYDVTVRADPGQAQISGQVALSLEPVGQLPVDSFTLDLHGPKVTKATVAGRPATVTATDAEITIRPAAALTQGKATTVVLDYAGTPAHQEFPALDTAVGWQADDHGGWFTMSEPNGTSTWVPVSDHPSDKAVWSITLDTPSGVTGVSNGHLVSRRKVGDRTRWAWHEDQPMAPYLVLAAVGRYDLVSRNDGKRLLTFAFPPDLPAAERAGFDDTEAILDYFTKTFGPLPGAKDGEDAGAIVVDKKLEVALEAQSRPLFGLDAISGGRVGALSHELAHQWFGDSVTLSNWRDLWLNEGFATYGDWLYRDHTGQRSIERSVADAVEAYGSNGLTVRDPTGTATFDLVVYYRGALTLQALRKTVGDATFFDILRSWAKDQAGRSASSDDFVALASRLAHKDLAPLFHAWLDSAPQPALPS